MEQQVILLIGQNIDCTDSLILTKMEDIAFHTIGACEHTKKDLPCCCSLVSVYTIMYFSVTSRCTGFSSRKSLWNPWNPLNSRGSKVVQNVMKSLKFKNWTKIHEIQICQKIQNWPKIHEIQKWEKVQKSMKSKTEKKSKNPWNPRLKKKIKLNQNP